MSKKISINTAWTELIKNYNIIDKIGMYGTFDIKADQIKRYKEPRLMAKFDCSETLPEIFKSNKINILPTSRSSYVLGRFNLYQTLPDNIEQPKNIKYIKMPYYESINAENITSEATAINAMLLSGILDDFLNTDKNAATFNGRMCTDNFEFYIETHNKAMMSVTVHNAQIEIDGGFENSESVIILEAKNILNADFNIRQLYYPYRLWAERVRKPIRLIYSVYSNLIYRLFEYKFEVKENYSSIRLLKQKNYSLQNTEITMKDIEKARRQVKVKNDDNQNKTDVPFIQANSMERVIALLENLYNNQMTTEQIADFMNFTDRQADYYYNAGRYLKLFQKLKDDGGDTVICLTSLGEKIVLMQYKERQLSLVKLILEHRIFMEFFDKACINGEIASTNEITQRMIELNVCGESQMKRRASSVYGWLKWIFSLQS